MIPLHTPSIELCIPFNNCKCTFFKISWINHKTRTFSQLFHCIKMHLLALWSLFTDEMANFPTHSYTSASEIANISFTWKLKKVTLSGVASPYRPLLRVTSPPGAGGGVGIQLQGPRVLSLGVKGLKCKEKFSCTVFKTNLSGKEINELAENFV